MMRLAPLHLPLHLLPLLFTTIMIGTQGSLQAAVAVTVTNILGTQSSMGATTVTIMVTDTAGCIQIRTPVKARQQTRHRRMIGTHMYSTLSHLLKTILSTNTRSFPTPL